MEMRAALLLVILLSFFGCREVESINREASFTAYTETQLAGEQHNDTIFLGYVFGTLRDDFGLRTKMLQESEKLYENENGFLAYKMTVDAPKENNEFEVTFNSEFYNDRLYKVSLSAAPLNRLKHYDDYLNVVHLFKKRYGAWSHYRPSSRGQESEYIWLHDNRLIEITMDKYTGLVHIVYTDALAKKTIYEDEKREIKQRSNASSEDI